MVKHRGFLWVLFMSWIDIYENVSRFLDKHDPKRKFSFKDKGLESKFLKMLDRMKVSFVREKLNGEIGVAKRWIRIFRKAVDELYVSLGLEHKPLYSREFASFLENVEHHLTKKLVFYIYDLLREKLDVNEFVEKAGAAITTSLKTNLRTLYQNWVFVSVLKNLSELGAQLIYPEIKYLLLTRAQQQKLATMPPNAIIATNRGYLSFFIEIPRPIAWGDSKDLERVWKLYTSLRPDICVYGDKVMDALDLSGEIAIKRPDVIIECKELEDWYKRRRDLRGPFAEIMSVEKWRTKWIRGLYDGLADAAGFIMKTTKKKKEKQKVIYLSDPEIVKLYQRVYRPKKFYLVSRSKVPKHIRSDLEDNGITVIDGVGFNYKRIKQLAESLVKIAKKKSIKTHIGLSEETSEALRHLAQKLGLPESKLDEVIKILVRYALKNLSELKELFMEGKFDKGAKNPDR